MVLTVVQEYQRPTRPWRICTPGLSTVQRLHRTDSRRRGALWGRSSFKFGAGAFHDRGGLGPCLVEDRPERRRRRVRRGGAAGIRSDAYWPNGGLPHEAHTLGHTNQGKEVYYSERGIKSSRAVYDNEIDACQELYGRLLSDQRARQARRIA